MQLLTILKQYWGFDQFRPLQREIIESILNGKDTLALLPTGGGKSICYQVPAMAKDGLCLVVSPLIALMKDQVQNLQKKGVTAFAIYGGQKRSDVIHTLKLTSKSNCKFLYVSPERLETTLFLEYLPALNVSLIAVDEAHCISQWGYDFRPPYLRIDALRKELPDVPILALTASATIEVQKDICTQLNFTNEQVFRQSFSRPNLSYSLFKVDAKINKLVEILRKVQGSSIVYCRSRRRAKEICDLLKSYQIAASYYHGGLTTDERATRQEEWMKNRVRVMVCTNAFGMGIDKPDVRTVVHVDVPDCLENYYQESGRAGRDGNKSYAVLLYQEKDLKELQEQIDIRFPSVETIRMVYQSICNHLQLPVGSPAGEYHSFDIAVFVNAFKLSAVTVVNALKVLEQEGYMSFNEQFWLPSSLQFVCNKERLYQFETDFPLLEPIVKLLLRTYEGIFDRSVIIYEQQLAGLLKKTVDEIKWWLNQLHGYGIIDYEPQKDTPRLVLAGPRVKSDDLRINSAAYAKRRMVYGQRVISFITYILNKQNCRSQQIGNYFGDELLNDCGVCDNCLLKKRKQLRREEFEAIKNSIQQLISESPQPVNRLLTVMRNVQSDKLWQVIRFLEAEKKIILDASGVIRTA
jgi:ATP-dependent DNA helicase RecQ